jgi:acetaldehyde dehydrogenase
MLGQPQISHQSSETREFDAGVKAAIVGAGIVGGALASRLAQQPGRMRLALVTDRVPAAPGLRRARELGVASSAAGLQAVLAEPQLAIVFDATSPRAHAEHAALLSGAGIAMIDLTAAAGGAPVVPLVNLDEGPWSGELSLLSCPAQAAVPLVRAVACTTPVLYAECVSVIPASALGPVARISLDELIAATERGLEQLGGAMHSKAILAVSPADPPVAMRNTVHVVPAGEFERDTLDTAIAQAAAAMRRLVPGYRMRGEPLYERHRTPWGERSALTLTVEVAGDGERLPAHAGSVELVVAAAQALGERLAHSSTQTLEMSA